jgi:hypothetical protein
MGNAKKIFAFIFIAIWKLPKKLEKRNKICYFWGNILETQ